MVIYGYVEAVYGYVSLCRAMHSYVVLCTAI